MPRWLPGVLLFLLAAGVYARSPFNGFIWDDPAYVTDNPTLKTVGGLWDIWADPLATPQYYPAVHTSFWVEARLWGTRHAAGFHVDNVLLHAAAAVLLWRALLAVGVPWPWLAAAVFAVHPVMVESVAWVTERKNVLSITFYLLAALAYVRTGWLLDEKPRVYTRGSPRAWYGAALALFLLALFSKTVTCSLPAALLLVVYWHRGRVTWADVKPLLPMFAIGLGMALLTAHLERSHVGATGRDFAWLTPAHRILIAGRAAAFYAGKVVWPARLLFMYPRWPVDPRSAAQWLYPLAVATVVAALFVARRRLGRGPLVGVLFFLGTLVPALGFVNVYPMRYSWVADHFQYLASTGLIATAVAGLHRLSQRIDTAATARGKRPRPIVSHEGTKGRQGHENRTPADRPVSKLRVLLRALVPSCETNVDDAGGAKREAIVAVLVLVPLAVLTWRQQAIYRDAETLWRDTVARNPASWMAHVNLSAALRGRGDADAALAESEIALAMAPGEGDTHYDVGNAYARRGQWPAAVAEFRRAAELSPQVPAVWSTLAHALWDHGDGTATDRATAVAAAQRAVGLDPNLSEAQAVLSDYATGIGDRAGAVAHAERAAAVEPDNPAAHVRLGAALARADRVGDAAGEFRRAVVLDPSDAASWTNLGYCGLRAGRPAEAADAFRHALAINPALAPARAGLQRATGGG